MWQRQLLQLRMHNVLMTATPAMPRGHVTRSLVHIANGRVTLHVKTFG